MLNCQILPCICRFLKFHFFPIIQFNIYRANRNTVKAKSCYVGSKSIINYAYNKSTISNCFIIMSFTYHKVVCIGFYSFAIFQGICFILQILTGWFSNPICDSRLQYVWKLFFSLHSGSALSIFFHYHHVYFQHT